MLKNEDLGCGSGGRITERKKNGEQDEKRWRDRGDRRWDHAIYPGRVSHRCQNRTHTLCPLTFLAQHCKGTNHQQRFNQTHVNWAFFFAKHHLPLWKRACDNLKLGCQSTPPSPRGAGICKQAAVTLFNAQPFSFSHHFTQSATNSRSHYVDALEVLFICIFCSHFSPKIASFNSTFSWESTNFMHITTVDASSGLKNSADFSFDKIIS